MILISGRPTDPTRRAPKFQQLVALAALLLAASVVTLLLNTRTDGTTVLWPCNALTLGVLLMAPRRHWIFYLSIAFAVDMGVNLFTGGQDPLNVCLLLALCNTIEILVAAAMLAQSLSPAPDLTDFDQLLKFLLYGVVLAPAVAAALACVGAEIFGNAGAFKGYWSWLGADALGIATMTPLYLSLGHDHPLHRRSGREIFGLLLLIVLATLLTFSETKYPLLFVIAPVLLIAGARLGLVGSSIGLVIVSALGGFLTSLGLGPMNIGPHASTAQHIVMFQFFIGFSMLMLYGTEVMTHRNNALQEAVADSEARFRLLTETSRDIILLSDPRGRHIYVSPVVTEMLGWLPDRLISKTYDDIVHPDDVELVARLLDNCRTGGSKSAVYRCRRLDGTYIWVETTIRLYNDPASSTPVGLVSVMRDISGRKAAEEELQAAYKKVAALATVDGLTGVANRRRLDEVMEQEWRRAFRDRRPISVLMFDVDHFKAYNDIYGHLGGDDCLRQIADAAFEVVRRPGDLIARYGGEEFAVILPNTDVLGCREIAEEIRSAIERRELPHPGNPHKMITVSIGCATMIPGNTTGSARIIKDADQALYRAKKSGRNQVRCADEQGSDAAAASGFPANVALSPQLISVTDRAHFSN